MLWQNPVNTSIYYFHVCFILKIDSPRKELAMWLWHYTNFDVPFLSKHKQMDYWEWVFTWDFILRKMKYFHLCLVNFWFTWYNPKYNRNEISFWVIKYHVNTTRNDIIRKETSAHMFTLSKQKWLAFTEWAVSVGPPPKQKFHFILLDLKRNSFLVG